jgi:stress-induced morphogen
MMAATSQPLGPIVSSLQAKLEAALAPISLRIRNDSKGHASHYSEDGSEAHQSGETHLAVKIVSEKFGELLEPQSLLQLISSHRNCAPSPHSVVTI